MGQKFKDNGRALLQASILPSDTSLTVEASKADNFPIANTPNWAAVNDWFKAILFDASGNREVVKVGVRAVGSGVMSNLLRAQDGTAALNFPAGSAVIMDVTAADIENVLAGLFPNLNILGQLDIGTFFHCVKRAYTDVVMPGVHAADLVLDARDANIWELPPLTSNINTFTINNATPGQSIEVVVKQGGAGNYTVANPAGGSKISGTPALGVGRVSKLFIRKSARDDVWQGFWVPIAA